MMTDQQLTAEQKETMGMEIDGTEKADTPPHANVKVIRTSIHNGRMAPAGCVFIVATAYDKMDEKRQRKTKYTSWKLIYTKGLTDEEETKIKLQLATHLVEHYKL